ncbi:Two component transcriptional regulator, LuxR family [Paraburkholderia ribeironis]|uniref:Two component transcriptional regulator, LuxR family n=1 Tax=Paraburkholderia ribeironis TaxID=1247936 RepID=A0A1N7RT54_9BURK|nr:response regulator transcription factor [Paraburkholderia ribeironis]SIT38278.1 Two component transcriptional regulator, LuxR family [Paraburkholderia ribeironis]
MTSSTIRVMLADHYPAMLSGVQLELKKSGTISAVGATHNSTDLVTALDCIPCDVLLTGYVMPGDEYGDGLALFKLIRQRYPNLKIVVLTMMEHPSVLHSIITMGNRCIVSKSDPTIHLTQAVHAAYANRPYLSPRIESIVGSTKRGRRGSLDGSPLTLRELDVIRLFISGISVGEIAEQLNRSKKTISSQKCTAMAKLGIKRDTDLVRYGIESGLVLSTKSVLAPTDGDGASENSMSAEDSVCRFFDQCTDPRRSAWQPPVAS